MLSERERRFVDYFMGEAAGNGTKAAELAGYSVRTAASQASRLLRKANIRQAVEDRQASDPAVMDRAARQRFWSAAAQNPDVPWPARIRASELLAKAGGDFIERHEHSGTVQVVASVTDARL